MYFYPIRITPTDSPLPVLTLQSYVLAAALTFSRSLSLLSRVCTALWEKARGLWGPKPSARPPAAPPRPSGGWGPGSSSEGGGHVSISIS